MERNIVAMLDTLRVEYNITPLEAENLTGGIWTNTSPGPLGRRLVAGLCRMCGARGNPPIVEDGICLTCLEERYAY